MQEFNPSDITASIEEINALSNEQLLELNSTFRTMEKYLKVSYKNNFAYATYGSLVSLRGTSNKGSDVKVIEVLTAKVESITTAVGIKESEILAPKRTEIVAEEIEEIEEDVFIPASESEKTIEELKELYFAKFEKQVSSKFSTNREWILNKLNK